MRAPVCAIVFVNKELRYLPCLLVRDVYPRILDKIGQNGVHACQGESETKTLKRGGRVRPLKLAASPTSERSVLVCI
jgi:hypothetical protein